MLHRHLNHQRFTLAAIDDVISRGRWQDWVALRRAALQDQSLMEKVRRICRPYVVDPYAQRYHFWLHYVEEHQASWLGAGWKTARIQRPVPILGSLDGIETGVRQLIRDEPLETMVVDYHGEPRFCSAC